MKCQWECLYPQNLFKSSRSRESRTNKVNESSGQGEARHERVRKAGGGEKRCQQKQENTIPAVHGLHMLLLHWMLYNFSSQCIDYTYKKLTGTAVIDRWKQVAETRMLKRFLQHLINAICVGTILGIRTTNKAESVSRIHGIAIFYPSRVQALVLL